MYFENLLKGVPNELAREVLDVKREIESNFNDSSAKARFIKVAWNLYKYLAENIDESFEIEKRLFLRYGMLDTKYLNSRDLERIKRIPFVDNKENIFYVDEWLLAVKKGEVNESSYFEVNEKKSKVTKGNIKFFVDAFNEKINERSKIEKELQRIVENIDGGEESYKPQVLKLIDEAISKLKRLKVINRDIEILEDQLKDLKNKNKQESNFLEETRTSNEHEVIMQMINKSIGRLGNKFFVLTSIFLANVSEIGYKEVVERKIREIEMIDYKIFYRRVRGIDVKIEPYFILVPGYGDYGFCWEPFEGMNTVSGRGRVVIPMFPKSLSVSVLYALGDYRWKATKELSYGRWMEEGLTGEIYNYLLDNKIKERLEDFFIKRYVLWILKESQGVQKLEKKIREIFWRYIEFPEKLKEALSKKSYIYKDLYEKDQRRKKNWENRY